jgi:hypothetical protein
MTATRKIIALDDEVGPPRMTSDEWVLIDRYIGNSRLDSWGDWSEDRIAVARAFQKAYSYPRVSSDAVAKIWKCGEESRARV